MSRAEASGSAPIAARSSCDSPPPSGSTSAPTADSVIVESGFRCSCCGLSPSCWVMTCASSDERVGLPIVPIVPSAPP